MLLHGLDLGPDGVRLRLLGRLRDRLQFLLVEIVGSLNRTGSRFPAHRLRRGQLAPFRFHLLHRPFDKLRTSFAQDLMAIRFR
jgi:hypothetical protein